MRNFIELLCIITGFIGAGVVMAGVVFQDVDISTKGGWLIAACTLCFILSCEKEGLNNAIH